MHKAAVFLSVMVLSIAAGVTTEEQRRELSARIVGDIIDCRFERAATVADSVSAACPDDPVGPLLHLLCLGMREVDYDRVLDSAAFLSAYASTLSRVKVYESRNGESGYSVTMAGIANIAHASYFLRRQRYLAAVGTGMDGLKLLERAREMDSTNLDADFFLGLYDYARGELKKRLWMVLFWYPGSRQRGISRLEACSREGSITAAGAKLALAEIYVKEAQFTKADALIGELKGKYPRSRFVMWSEAKYHEARAEYLSAAGTYGRLADSYEGSRYGRHNGLTTRLLQAEALRRGGDAASALSVLRLTLARWCPGEGEGCGEVCAEIEELSRRLDEDR